MLLGAVVCLLHFSIAPVLAKKNPSEKREIAIGRLIDSDAKKNHRPLIAILKKPSIFILAISNNYKKQHPIKNLPSYSRKQKSFTA
ncbi:hypothetical protein ID47_00755 [Candidatus Paracaedibacter acanthamoebae]|uniref:Uncharacterized protein n=1 Tax=Candidatus Odyssella acanthamoebae TaxID=91604 RepID=A0A077AT90_9PROT|nr:hypothetical protein ID47_00755 [Candidatus Paracaedibacter acanthamoebae]